MSQQITTISLEAIQYMCGLIRDLASVSEAIDNTNLADDKVFSNLYTKKLIDKCLEDANTESQKLVGALTHLTCEETTVQPTLDNSSINVIYLYSATGNEPYQQYLKISDTKLIDLGSTSVSLSAYLTATEIARDYVTKLDFDALKTEVKRKVDKTSILTTIDNLATDDQVYSAKATYDLANTKANTNHTHTASDITDLSIPSKTSELENDSNYLSTEDITNTINSTSTETEIPTAKSVNVAIKGKLITQDDIDTYGKEIIKFPVGKWVIGSVAINNLTDLPNSYVRYIEIIGISEVTNPWTNDNTLRSYKATSYKGDTFLRSLNSGSEAGVIASDTGWQRVLLNGDIIDNLTSTDTNKLLSANQGKILNDTKLNKTDANKLNCVVIDNVSLKEYILTNFTVAEGKTYHLIANTTCTDLPKASNFYITVETPGLYTYKVTAKELNDSNGIYVCTYRTISSSWTEWQKVCTTTVTDVKETSIEFDKTALGLTISNNRSIYKVINGICYVTIELLVDAPSENKSYGYTKVNTTSLPKIGFNTKYIINVEGANSTITAVLDKGTTEIKLHGNILANQGSYIIQGSFSYPVAE